MDPDQDNDWAYIVDQSAYTINGVCQNYNFDRQSLVSWLNRTVKPRKENRVRLTAALTDLLETKPLARHPSFGFATKEQIDKINALGIGPERNAILDQIEAQQKLNGKIA